MQSRNSNAKSKKVSAEYSADTFFLFTLEAIAAGAFFGITITIASHVNLGKRTIIARAIILTFRNVAADARVDVHFVFVHHIFVLLLHDNLFKIYFTGNLRKSQ